MMTREKGQALPLALLALAFGTLVISPFLSHASSSLLGSRVYGEAIAMQSAADAGVEHAIWQLTNGGLADEFAAPGDEVTYSLGETVNSFTPSITVTANATGGGGGTAGDISDAVIDTLDFAPDGGEPVKIVNIAGNVYAVVYTDSRNDGWVKTLEVAADGTITETAIDALEFDTRQGQWTDIIPVAGDVYAIAYQGEGSDGFVITVAIASDGQVGNSVIDSLEFDTQDCLYPEMVHVAGDTYAVAYQGRSNDGFVKTVTIASNGQIGNRVIDSLEFDTGNGQEPDIIPVSGGIYAIAYRGNGNDGFVVTVAIAGDGRIANTVVDSFEFNTSECNFPVLGHIYGDIYVVVYDGDSAANQVWGGGIITTVAIAADGSITKSIVDEGVFDSDAGAVPDIVYVGGNVYAIAYAGRNSDGWLKTLSITADGSIGGDIIDSLEFDGQVGYYPDIMHVAGDVFAIAYTGSNQWHGMLKTVGITAAGGVETAAAYRIIATAADCTIRALVNIAGDNVSIASWRVE